jgi:hypothetical protein
MFFSFPYILLDKKTTVFHNFTSWKKRILFISFLFVISNSIIFTYRKNYLLMHGKISVVCLKKFDCMWRELSTYMLYFLVYLADVASGYSMGAPDAACSDMTPGHQHRPQVKHFKCFGPRPGLGPDLLGQWVRIQKGQNGGARKGKNKEFRCFEELSPGTAGNLS